MRPNDEESSVDDSGAAPLPDPVENRTPPEGCLSFLVGFLGGVGFQGFFAFATIAAISGPHSKPANDVLITFVVSYATNLLLTILLTREMLRSGREMAGSVFLLISIVSILLGSMCSVVTFRRL